MNGEWKNQEGIFVESENTFLKQSILEVVANQLNNNDPPEVRQTFARLQKEGITEENAKIYIAQAVCVELWDTMKNSNPFNRYGLNSPKLASAFVFSYA
jgi:hypothetical protein